MEARVSFRQCLSELQEARGGSGAVGILCLGIPSTIKGLTNALVIQLTPCCQSVLAYC